MHRLLLATLLLTAVSASAMAAYPKAQAEIGPRHVVSKSELQRSPQRGAVRGQYSDPYWTPCDYSTDYGADACE